MTKHWKIGGMPYLQRNPYGFLIHQHTCNNVNALNKPKRKQGTKVCIAVRSSVRSSKVVERSRDETPTWQVGSNIICVHLKYRLQHVCLFVCLFRMKVILLYCTHSYFNIYRDLIKHITAIRILA